ncbi:serpin family protein [Nocardioides sp.]|uniref:serpin family protein n=1 Tax=Nocardioides sp. TaxID=35761 RepID=UPI0031FEF1E6
MNGLTRRDLMRSLSLAALAVTVPGLVAGCSSDDPGRPGDPGGSTDLELVSSDVKRSDGDLAAVPDAVASIHTLGAGLYAQGSSVSGNLALSPYSVAVALALTLNGARGATLDEMLAVLAADDTEGLNGGLNALTQEVEALAGKHRRLDGSTDDVALDSANALFGQRGVDWQKDFLDTLAREYGAGMQTVDFETATESARGVINDWTADRTHDRIEEIIPPDVLDPSTRLVLVNALYFKAPWFEPFEKGATSDRPFHLEDGSVVRVPTMTAGLASTSYGTGDGWQAVRMTYAGNDLAMTVVLPDKDRLADVEAAVGGGELASILGSVQPTSVSLSLPRWTFRTATALNEALAALGMRIAFGGGADFSGMTTEADLYVAAVLHQVFIAVDEDGTEAAAATAVAMDEMSAMLPGASVVVDRPFLFVIHDVAHGTPLFVGRVVDPRD